MCDMPISIYDSIYSLVTPTNTKRVCQIQRVVYESWRKNNVTLHSIFQALNGNRVAWTCIHKLYGLLVLVCTQSSGTWVCENCKIGSIAFRVSEFVDAPL